MPLIVETGDANPLAESYASIADADAYATARGLSGWTGTTTVKESALRKGTGYIDLEYRGRFKGYRATETQALQWPRAYVVDDEGYSVDSDEIPGAIVRATIEAAIRALTNDLLPDLTGSSGLTAESVKVGPISISSEWSGSNNSETTRFPQIERSLFPYLRTDSSVERG